MPALNRTPDEIQAELADLHHLLQQAERRHDDPEAEIAASLFRQLIRRRERALQAAGLRFGIALGAAS